MAMPPLSQPLAIPPQASIAESTTVRRRPDSGSRSGLAAAAEVSGDPGSAGGVAASDS